MNRRWLTLFLLSVNFVTLVCQASAEEKRAAPGSEAEATENIKKPMHEIDGTIGDQKFRPVLQSILAEMQTSMENISKSIERVNKVDDDRHSRSAIKKLVTKANTAIDKVNRVVSKPANGSQIESTIKKIECWPVSDPVKYSGGFDKESPERHHAESSQEHLHQNLRF